ncbi:MAG: OmpA family protein, partial [Rhodospirillales bacterium]
KRLVAALVGGGIDKAPKDAAMAQAMFDCWMQEQEENFQPEDIAACRKNFEMAMAALAGTLPGPYVVYFDFASAAITADAKTEIMKVAAVYKNGGVGSISLAGNTDTVGNAAANQALSEKRAAAVASALKGAGVPASAIKMSYAGETKLKINTEDNVQERLNRRVEIMLKP